MEIMSRNMDTDGIEKEIISRIWIHKREEDYLKNIDNEERRNMDINGKRRLYQEYGYRREKEIISGIWIQTGEGDYVKEYGYRREKEIMLRNMDT